MNIVTVTLSPAFDIHCEASSFVAGHENIAHITEREAGGKGINISRALAVQDVPSVALVAVGEENSEDFCRLLENDGISYIPFSVSGRIRENITVHTSGAPETRLSFDGFCGDCDLLFKIKEKLNELICSGDIVTFTGRVPSKISMSELKALIADLEGRGIRVVVDSRSFSRADLIECRPWLIKPNSEEICEYLGHEVDGFDDVIEGARELCRSGIKNVMVTLGSMGALLATDSGCYIAYPPKIQRLSTIGAGDSSIAGFITAVCKSGEDNTERLLQTAVAYGTAACLTAGTKPPCKDAISWIFEQIKVEKI